MSRRCNMTCAHCSVESNPHIKLQPDEQELRDLVDRLVEARVGFVQFTGGEPMLREELLLELIAKVAGAGIPCNLVSNGFWGKKPERALDKVRKLKEAGLCRLAISYDRFHAEFQGPQPALNIAEAARSLGSDIHLHITRAKDDSDLDEIVEPFRNLPHVHLRFYDLQPVGYARNLQEELRGQLDGFCSSCEQATFTDNGRVTACNGPAYFEKSDSGLVVGEYRSGKTSVEEILRRHVDDRILQTIRTDGPMALKKTLEALPGFEDFPFKEHYAGMCELCLQINADSEAVKALREELSLPKIAAGRLARKLVLEANRSHFYHRFQVNKELAPAAVLKLLLGTPEPNLDKIVGRADVDWEELADRLRAGGLLGLVAAPQVKEALRDWAPVFFWERCLQAGDSKSRVDEIMATAAEHCLSLKPRGATAVAGLGGGRLPSSLEFAVAESELDSARTILGSRLEYEVRLEPDIESALEGFEKTAWELLVRWRQERYKGGLELAWDLNFLQSKHRLDWPRLWSRARECGEEKTLAIGLEVLNQKLALEVESLPCPSQRGGEFLRRVVGFQYSRQAGSRDNCLLELAVGLSGLTSVWGLPGVVKRALRSVLVCLNREGWSRFLDDLNQAFQLAGGGRA